MQCDEAREAVSALLDQELNESTQATLSDHLKQCQMCHEWSRRASVIDGRLKTEIIAQTDNPRIWARVSAALDKQDQHGVKTAGLSEPVNLGRRRTVGFGSAGIGSVFAVAAAAGIGFFGHRFYADQPNLVVRETVNDFLTFRASGKALHIENASPAKIKDWLATRVSFDLAINPAPPAGFTLKGGRLCSFLSRRLVFFFYEKGEHAVSVYLMDEDGLSLPEGRQELVSDKAVTMVSANGVSEAIWRHGGLLYVVVSDLPEDDVLRFAASVQAV